MHRSREVKKHKFQLRGCKALCCSCRLSVSSSSEEAESSNSVRFPTISSIAHAMVQERLDQMIRERREARIEERRRIRHRETKFVVMVAMEKSSYDPREDFRESMEQMIMVNRIREAKDLRSLLDYYVTMNSEEYRGIILEVFHEVCTNLFLYCKCL
ncbi:putative transcription repressor OFP9 [Forsythia ovata]|uniref:Transcription repressor n=1 Tax=Forsythia ovata TaxID=205694 RepID=A0ABD1S401_9LAMI